MHTLDIGFLDPARDEGFADPALEADLAVTFEVGLAAAAEAGFDEASLAFDAGLAYIDCVTNCQ